MSAGIIHSRLRDWRDGSHPGYALGAWLRGYLDSAAGHDVTALDAISGAHRKPWLPPLPALA